MRRKLRKRLKNERKRQERFAVLSSYGTPDHLECLGVVIQNGGTESGGQVLDSRVFWSRDYKSLEEMNQAVADWSRSWCVTKAAVIEGTFPVQDLDLAGGEPCFRALTCDCDSFLASSVHTAWGARFNAA
jgi:hypothetical protein